MAEARAGFAELLRRNAAGRDCPAFVDDDETVTWGGAAHRAGALEALVATGSLPAAPVTAVVARRTAAMASLVCALLAAGRPVVTLDPARNGGLTDRLRVSGATWVVHDDVDVALRAAAPDSRVRWSSLADVLTTLDATTAVAPAGDGTLAYLAFTSGSSGEPKAVAVRHSTYAAGLAVWGPATGLTSDDVVLQVAGPSFDVFYQDIGRAVAAGCTLRICPDDVRLAPERLAAMIRREGVTFLDITPSVFRLLRGHLEWTGQVLPDLRTLVLGGEPWRPAEYEEIAAVVPRAAVINTYGLVETGIDNLHHVGPPPAPHIGAAMPLGRPYPGCDLRLVDPDTGEPTSADTGELAVVGEFVAAGYWDGAARRVTQPFLDDDGAAIFRTGDLVHRDPSGQLWFMGRIGMKVKLHGEQLSLDAVDAVLLEQPGVHDAVSVLVPGGREPTLVSVVVGEHPMQPQSLRSAVRAALGPLAVPQIVTLDSLPLTPSGKVDRQRLLTLAASRLTADHPGARDVAALHVGDLVRDEVERVVGEPVQSVDLTLAELGIDSLRAATIAHRLRNRLGPVLEMVLPAMTLGDLLESVARPAVAPRTFPGSAQPLSRTTPEQEALLVHSTLHEDPAAYVVPVVLEVIGRLQADVLREACEALLARHAPLRSRYWFDGTWRVVVENADASRDGWWRQHQAQTDGDARRWIDQFVSAPIDLSRSHPFRAALVRAGTRTWLALAIHHVATDGLSSHILLRELGAFYRTISAGGTVVPSAPDRSFAEFVAHRGRVTTGYWEDVLTGYEPPAPMPDALDEGEGRSSTAALNIGEPLTRRLREHARAAGVSVFAILAAATALAEAQWSGQEDVCLGYPSAARPPGFDDTVGFFVRTHLLRLRVAEGTTTTELLAQAALSLTEHQRNAGLESAPVSKGGAPVFRTWLNHLGPEGEVPDLPDAELRVQSQYDYPAIFDRTIYIEEGESDMTLRGVLRERGRAALAHVLLAQLVLAVERVLDGHHEVSEVLTSSTELPVPDGLLNEEPPRLLLDPECWAEAAEDAAVRSGTERVSHADVARRARALSPGVMTMTPTRTADGVADLAAALLRRGPARTVLDPDGLLDVDALPPLHDAIAIPHRVREYVMATSGTTAARRAVLNTTDRLEVVLGDYVQALRLTAADRFCVLAGMAHDPVLRDVLVPLALGAAVWVPTEEERLMPGALLAALRQFQPTVLNLTPQLARLICSAADQAGDDTALPSVRWVVLAGDQATRGDVDRLYRLFRASTVFNGYGLTQTPQLAAMSVAPPGRTPRIGPGRPGTVVDVVDAHGRRRGVGQPGQIRVRGRWLAAGLVLPVEGPETSTSPPVRVLLTGDRGVRQPDGTIRYLGRLDDKVLVDGHLVDPRAVDLVLAGRPGVAETCTVLRSDDGALCTFVVGSAPPAQIRRDVSRVLPRSHVPRHVIHRESLPRTENGKVDVSALRQDNAPTALRAPRHRDSRRSATEQTVHQVWASVLGTTEFGMHDNFFDLGGTSLDMVLVEQRLREVFPDSPPSFGLLNGVSVAEAAAFLDGLDERQTVEVELLPRPRRRPGTQRSRRLGARRQFEQQEDA